MCTTSLGRRFALYLAALLLTLPNASAGVAQELAPQPIVYKIQANHDRIEMTVRSSRILTIDGKIPRAQVNNPDVLDLQPISATQIQVYAKKTGVTQVTLWDEKDQARTCLVIVSGDAQELALVLQREFPSAALRVSPANSSVILSGFVDRADYVPRIIRIAEDYYPKVIDNITVGGAQQVLLHTKVMEISRTKLRDVGMDFANISGNDFVTSSVSGLLSSVTATSVATTGADHLTFGIVDSGNSFFGVLSAMQRYQLAKILAEPTLVTVSGRPASFTSGGEIPILIPQSLGTVSIDYKKFGTQIDFVPIVLGNGNVRLEVLPRVSELDESISVTLNGSTIPGFRTREVNTGVEMKAGQTLALAGLIQTRTTNSKSGFPWVSDLPYVGFPFRRTTSFENEVELLIMVRPEWAEALDCDEVPPGGPGMNSKNPNSWDLHLRGHVEVPLDYGPHKLRRAIQGVPAGEPAAADCDVPQETMEEMPVGQPQPPSIGPDPAPTPPDESSIRIAPLTVARKAANPVAPTPGRSTGRTFGPRGPQKPSNPQRRPAPAAPKQDSGQPGFIGDIGYDVVK